jgi:hypothetical protein
MKFAKMINKRGVGDIIGWVLLIGFGVALATSVFIWMKGQTEEMTESTVNYVEGEMVCEDVAINVAVNEMCNELTIVNKGKFNIDALNIIYYPATGEPGSKLENPATPLKPIAGEKITISVPQSVKFEITPVLKTDENKLNGCKNKKEVISCTV